MHKIVALIKKYFNLSFEHKTIFSIRISFIKTLFWGAIKIVFAAVTRSMLIGLSGLSTILSGLAKTFCYSGVRRSKDDQSVKRYNYIIAALLMCAGLCYGLYFLFVLLTEYRDFWYPMFIGVMIAFFSFVDLGFAIAGMVRAKGRGLLFKDIKIINLMGALTALVLTQVAIFSFTETPDSHIVNGAFGIAVGGILLLTGFLMMLSPYIYAALDERKNYKSGCPQEEVLAVIKEHHTIEECEDRYVLPVAKVWFAGTYVYEFGFTGDDETILTGKILRNKPRRPKKIWQKILLIFGFIFYIMPYMALKGLVLLWNNKRRWGGKLTRLMAGYGFERVKLAYSLL